MIRKLKDQALAWTVSRFVTTKLEKYGEVLGLDVDSAERIIRGKFRLRGESEPLYAVLSGYEVSEDGDHLWLTYSSLETSREWLNQLLKDLLPNNSIRLPAQASRYPGILRLLLH
ncbi:MAG TPA: hypothetical protein PLP42_04780 [Acidobacteriota bacterium]|nr:hypothetical protein [Acidobacteriota bacterium]